MATLTRYALGAMGAVVLVAAALFGGSEITEAAFAGKNGKIAFYSYRGGVNHEIYDTNPDATSRRNLTASASSDSIPAYSSDGKDIVFRSYRDGNAEIYRMSADGALQTRLTRNAAYDSDPAWSPNGKKIAFNSNRDGNAELYIMSANGASQIRLTSNTATDAAPSWQPLPK